ncbi:hypothetical protein GALMADRAFT_1130862 [Galerina marginata CBS 339.88]|uniref:Uncharacterized protein n=1 Tax=Galerina marginata (strain CBS 339.88) TaxID=685588 RepID=A0A067SB39_GALM3|nr:hypothetical protein GALMADRAFT_1130862 [Galerina marginata CBS 339.88]
MLQVKTSGGDSSTPFRVRPAETECAEEEGQEGDTKLGHRAFLGMRSCSRRSMHAARLLSLKNIALEPLSSDSDWIRIPSVGLILQSSTTHPQCARMGIHLVSRNLCNLSWDSGRTLGSLSNDKPDVDTAWNDPQSRIASPLLLNHLGKPMAICVVFINGNITHSQSLHAIANSSCH